MIWVVFLTTGVAAGWLLGHGEMERNFREAWSWGPRGGLIVLEGVTLGLCGRDRVRLRNAYASPLLAILAKRLILASLVPPAVFAFAPVDWPPGWLDAFAAANGVGWAVWLANLPPRL